MARIAKKARKDHTLDVAWEIQAKLEVLTPADATDSTEVAVVSIFKAHPASPEVKGDAFMTLDEKPGHFGSSYFSWHSKLRRTRNHPVHGRALFATFRTPD